MVSSGSNDVPLHTSVAADSIDAGRSIDEAAARLREVLGRPLTDEERSQLTAAKARADALAEERGPDYPGFGHPPRDRA